MSRKELDNHGTGEKHTRDKTPNQNHDDKEDSKKKNVDHPSSNQESEEIFGGNIQKESPQTTTNLISPLMSEEVDNDEHLMERRPSLTKKGVNWNPESEREIASEKHEKQIKKKVSRIMLTLYALAFLTSFSYWVQSGVLPYLTRRVGMSPEMFGLMESSFALYQMITSPIYGRLGDVFGVRVIYMISELSASVTFGSLAFAESVPALFLTRIPALFMHSVQCAYMIITDISTDQDRADLIGKLGVLHGLGMIFGSVMGGILTHLLDEQSAALVAAISNLLSVFIIFVFIPNNTKKIRYQTIELEEDENNTHSPNHKTASESETTINPRNQANANSTAVPSFKAMIDVLRFKNIKFLLFIKIVIAFPFSLLYSMFSMAVMDYYLLGPRINGLLLGYIGVLTIIVQGVIVGVLTKRFTDAINIKSMILLNLIGFLFLVVATEVYVLVIVVIPLAIGGTVSHIVLLTVITKIVPVESSGTALGFIFALHAVVRAVAPSIGGLVFANLGWPFFGVFGYTFHVGLMAYVLLCGNDEQFDG